MSYADKIFVETCKDILANGFSDKDLHVRPRWEDGTPAHTIKKFGVVNRYDLKKQFPILTIRRTYWKSALDEVLWIWQKKSNNVQDLSSHIWDAWADETGSIGKAYGYQMGVKHHYKDGDYDQVDRVLKDLKEDPASRRILTNIYNHHDLSEMGLAPCAYSMTFNVLGNTLNAILNQRSQDMTTSVRGSIFLTSTRCPMPLSARTGTLWGTGCRRWWRPAEGLLASAFQRPLSHESQCRYCSSRALSITN